MVIYQFVLNYYRIPALIPITQKEKYGHKRDPKYHTSVDTNIILIYVTMTGNIDMCVSKDLYIFVIKQKCNNFIYILIFPYIYIS